MTEIAVVGVRGASREHIISNLGGLTWERWPNSRPCAGRVNVHLIWTLLCVGGVPSGGRKGTMVAGV